MKKMLPVSGIWSVRKKPPGLRDSDKKMKTQTVLGPSALFSDAFPVKPVTL